MMQTVAAWWNGLSETQRTIVITGGVVAGLGILASFVFLGTDYSGFGDWLQGWR